MAQMPTFDGIEPMRIAVYAFQGISMFHLAAPQMVFGGETARVEPTASWTTVLWSATGGDVGVGEGHRISGLAGPEAAADADMIVVPSWPEDLPPLDGPLRRILTDGHERGAIIVGLCLGAIRLPTPACSPGVRR